MYIGLCAQVEVHSTRLYLPIMLSVLQQTSQDREFLNRLRAFGLSSLIDAYLTSIASSDGARVGSTVRPFLRHLGPGTNPKQHPL